MTNMEIYEVTEIGYDTSIETAETIIKVAYTHAKETEKPYTHITTVKNAIQYLKENGFTVDKLIQCPYCGYKSEECDFPDLFYSDSNNTDGINQQYELLLEMQALGYNVVTCGECGQVMIIKHEVV